jgi:hypothetical protein
MKVAGVYSFNCGERVVRSKHPALLDEIRSCIAGIDASKCRTKTSKEKTMPGATLYSPVAMNERFEREFASRGWQPVRVRCDYPTSHYVEGYRPKTLWKGAFREMDFVKQRLGVEVQFGKYSFMVYNVAAKMTIFKNLNHIDMGVEIVPVKALADEMSSGVSYFEQFVWDLENRGVSNIDVPVMILGIDA